MISTRLRFPLAVLALLLGLAAALPRAAFASSLEKYSAKTEAKKIVLTFKFNESVDYEPVFHYKDNYVALKIKGLKFSRSQISNGAAPKGEEQKACFRKVGYTQSKSEGEIRIALNKKRSPGDVQVSPEDAVIRVEILLPTALIKPAAAGEDEDSFSGSPGPTAGSGTEEVEEAGTGEAPEMGPTSWPPTEGSAVPEEEEASEPEESAAIEAATVSDPDGFRDGGMESGVEELEGEAEAEIEAAVEDTFEPAAEPEESGTPGPAMGGAPIESGPSYKNFDLSTVAVTQQQFANIPLNEAVMLLIGDSGFNVVVGEGVSNTPVTLNFNQNQMSLERALRALCMAYDLEYSVEDDVIVVRGV